MLCWHCCAGHDAVTLPALHGDSICAYDGAREYRTRGRLGGRAYVADNAALPPLPPHQLRDADCRDGDDGDGNSDDAHSDERQAA
jgi:hypothetical protein